MKSVRTRILIVVIAAAVVVSFFTHWEDVSRGFRQGYESGRHHLAR
jgi:hypothetical protein